MKNLFNRNKKNLENKNKELLNYIKAIICKFSNNEFEISEEDVEKAQNMELYIEDSYMRYAKRLKVVSKFNYIKEK